MGYYISPRFLDKISVHITKNFLDLPNVKVPLILGIHGRKGEGKSFMCELVYKRMGIGVVYMSAGELESPDAGDPARLVRLRYREAGEWSRMHGRMAVLMINDLDAGAGRVDQFTQYTVNTQLVNATLMNIADNPVNVQLPGSYEEEPTQRIPIVVTGNDFSTLYAPLIRDGRMEKFYWDPDREDRIGIVSGIFEVDAIAQSDIETLVDTFPTQSIDFFSALRSRLYDEQVRHLIQEVGVDKISKRIMNSTEAPPEFRKPNFSLPHVLEVGQQMVREQERIRELRLVHEYNEPLQTSRRLGEVHWSSVYSEAKHETGRIRPSAYEESPPANGHTSHAAPALSPQPAAPRPIQSVTVRPPSSVREEDQQEIRRLMQQGYQVGIEYVDARRFRTNSWQSCAICQGNEEEAIAKLTACLTAHPGDYVRLVGISPGDRRRLFETIIQRP